MWTPDIQWLDLGLESEAHPLQVRVGGGYIYEKDGPDDKGLDTFFEVGRGGSRRWYGR